MISDYKPYDASEVESIRVMLEAEAKEGRPLEYEIKVNGFTRVHKTTNVARFEELHNFLNENTKELVISVYPNAGSNRKEWYKYQLNVAPESLNGIDVEAKISERVKQFEEKMAMQRMEEKLADTEKQLDQAEQYIDILEEKLELAKSKPNHLGNFDLGKLASSTIEGIALHYPKVLDKVPVLNGIAKVIQEENQTRPAQLNNGFEGEVSFKPKSRPEVEPNEHDEAVQQLSDFIAEHFDQHQKLLLGAVIVALGENPSQLTTVAELLNIDPNQLQTEEE
ncbi:MAG: hypothetical protein K0S33_3736 [Bacteroidetes bacterium]|jgi:hypothetical protein|nr:hypothetical protein [Bacteroidota bacterium]